MSKHQHECVSILFTLDGLPKDNASFVPQNARYPRMSRVHIPYRQARAEPLGCCRPRTPRPVFLCKALACLTGLLICIHALSCGLFFCVTLPSHRPSDPDDPSFVLPGLEYASSSSPLISETIDDRPKLIPRIIHQTYKTRNVPVKLFAVMQSWRDFHGKPWKFRFYDDAACVRFVEEEFPEYLEAYKALPKNVERSDFFRYLVILRMGGVYADIDVECRQPLDLVIRPSDTLVVGWESEVADDAEAFRRHFVRKRQLLQWFFAAAPGHPALREICDHVARNVHTKFSNNTNRDTLERTGPGVWTDIILKHALRHPMQKADDPWKVRILPRVSAGVHPAGTDNMTPDLKEIVVLHHFLGSWKVSGGWQRKSHNVVKQAFSSLKHLVLRTRTLQEPQHTEDMIPDAGVKLFPVSTSFDPPFTMLLPLKQAGDTQSGYDVPAVITAFGTYQAGLHSSRKPSVVDSLVGSLGDDHKKTLVDVGAGQGFFSLAAAARGHQVFSFELSDPSVDSLRSSMEYNGFSDLVKIHPVALGAVDESICTNRGGEFDSHDSSDVNMRRGYGPAQHHTHTPCLIRSHRTTLSKVLMNDTSVGAIRISVNGWEGEVITGAEEFLRLHPPRVVFVEFMPALMKKNGFADPVSVIHKMYELGYRDIAHSGLVCDERWMNITNQLRVTGGFSAAAQEALKQPTWCNLTLPHFQTLIERAHAEVPENLLFLYHKPDSASTPVATPLPPDHSSLPTPTSTSQMSGHGSPPPVNMSSVYLVVPARPQPVPLTPTISN